MWKARIEAYGGSGFLNQGEMRIILLDLGGVVFRASGRVSPQVDWEVITELNSKYGRDLDIGRDLFGQFLIEYNEKTDQQLSNDEFFQAIYGVVDFNWELLEFLKKRFEIIILSDNYRENIEYISPRCRFSEWAMAEFYSFDLGMTKADKALFAIVLDQLQVSAADCLLIDDDPGNVQLAAELGINGIAFENNRQIFQELSLL